MPSSNAPPAPPAGSAASKSSSSSPTAPSSRETPNPPGSPATAPSPPAGPAPSSTRHHHTADAEAPHQTTRQTAHTAVTAAVPRDPAPRPQTRTDTMTAGPVVPLNRAAPAEAPMTPRSGSGSAGSTPIPAPANSSPWTPAPGSSRPGTA